MMDIPASQEGKVKDLMVKEVVSVRPETPLVEAARLLTEGDFTGLPVTDKNGKLVGLVTEYNLIQRGTSVHLPTLAKLLKDFDFYKDDKDFVQPEIEKILNMKVADVMNADPATLSPEVSVGEAAQLFAEHHAINPVPVVDADRKLVGLVARFDIVRLFSASPATTVPVSVRSATPSDVETFLKSFEKRFVLVSRARTRWWLLLSILFIGVGFVIAFALILRLAT